jgi:hypothetical protein
LLAKKVHLIAKRKMMRLRAEERKRIAMKKA